MHFCGYRVDSHFPDMKKYVFFLPMGNFTGAISTEHISSELRVIGTNVHRVDSYFLHLTIQT